MAQRIGAASFIAGSALATLAGCATGPHLAEPGNGVLVIPSVPYHGYAIDPVMAAYQKDVPTTDGKTKREYAFLAFTPTGAGTADIGFNYASYSKGFVVSDDVKIWDGRAQISRAPNGAVAVNAYAGDYSDNTLNIRHQQINNADVVRSNSQASPGAQNGVVQLEAVEPILAEMAATISRNAQAVNARRNTTGQTEVFTVICDSRHEYGYGVAQTADNRIVRFEGGPHAFAAHDANSLFTLRGPLRTPHAVIYSPGGGGEDYEVNSASLTTSTFGIAKRGFTEALNEPGAWIANRPVTHDTAGNAIAQWSADAKQAYIPALKAAGCWNHLVPGQ